MRVLFTLIAISFAVVPAKSKNKSKKRSSRAQHLEVEVPINVGVGPSFYILPIGGFDHSGLHTGFELEAYAAISPTLIHSHVKKVPKKFRSMAKSMKDEAHIRPFPLPLIPQSYIISPARILDTNSGSAYGLIWQSMLGVGLLGLGDYQSLVSFKVGVGLGSLFYLYTTHPDLDDQSQHIYGLGGDVNTKLKFNMTSQLAIEFKGLAQFNYSNKYSYKSGDSWESTNFFPIYRAAATLNYRFGFKTKI